MNRQPHRAGVLMDMLLQGFLGNGKTERHSDCHDSSPLFRRELPVGFLYPPLFAGDADVVVPRMILGQHGLFTVRAEHRAHMGIPHAPGPLVEASHVRSSCSPCQPCRGSR